MRSVSVYREKVYRERIYREKGLPGKIAARA